MGQMNVIRVARAYITSRLESIQIPEISWKTITLMLLNVSEMIKRFLKKKENHFIETSVTFIFFLSFLQ